MADILRQARHVNDTPQQRHARLSNRFRLPEPIKRFFTTFPLQTHPAIESPHDSSNLLNRTRPILYAYGPGWLEGWTSFDIECLKWQAYLHFARVDFDIKYCNEPLCSPSGQLPFLLVPDLSKYSECLVGDQIADYAKKNSPEPIPELIDDEAIADSKAFINLAETKLDAAITFHMWADQENYTRRIVGKYGASRIHNEYLCKYLMESRRREILERTFIRVGDTLDREQIYTNAKEALKALSVQLEQSTTDYFFSSSKPTAIDAIIFAYIHTIMTFPCVKGHSELRDYVTTHHGILVGHARNIYKRLLEDGKDRVIGKVGFSRPDYSAFIKSSPQRKSDNGQKELENSSQEDNIENDMTEAMMDDYSSIENDPL